MDINIIDFIAKEFLWLMACLVILGAIIKQIPKIPNWLIPIILIILGIVLAGVFKGWSIDILLQGFLCGVASTGTHQVVKQTIERKN